VSAINEARKDRDRQLDLGSCGFISRLPTSVMRHPISELGELLKTSPRACRQHMRGYC
jgi:hypothetical protein